MTHEEGGPKIAQKKVRVLFKCPSEITSSWSGWSPSETDDGFRLSVGLDPESDF